MPSRASPWGGSSEQPHPGLYQLFRKLVHAIKSGLFLFQYSSKKWGFHTQERFMFPVCVVERASI
jgi:hypothetical protein